jgi:glucan biosynthesis protein C
MASPPSISGRKLTENCSEVNVNEKRQTLKFVVFVHLWGMPLLFLLAGASTWFARSYKTGTEYIRERFKRLAVPFIIGILIIVPPQIYIEGLSKSQFKGSFFDNYPRLFAKDPLTFDPQAFSNYGHHLWFLAFLFLFSCLDLPLSLFFRKKSGLQLISRIYWIFCGTLEYIDYLKIFTDQ